jgi:hypothetical protein
MRHKARITKQAHLFPLEINLLAKKLPCNLIQITRRVHGKNYPFPLVSTKLEARYMKKEKVAINIRLDAVVVNDLTDEAEGMGLAQKPLWVPLSDYESDEAWPFILKTKCTESRLSSRSGSLNKKD